MSLNIIKEFYAAVVDSLKKQKNGHTPRIPAYIRVKMTVQQLY